MELESAQYEVNRLIAEKLGLLCGRLTNLEEGKVAEVFQEGGSASFVRNKGGEIRDWSPAGNITDLVELFEEKRWAFAVAPAPDGFWGAHFKGKTTKPMPSVHLAICAALLDFLESPPAPMDLAPEDFGLV